MRLPNSIFPVGNLAFILFLSSMMIPFSRSDGSIIRDGERLETNRYVRGIDSPDAGGRSASFLMRQFISSIPNDFE